MTDPAASFRILPMGDRALLVEYDGLDAALAGYRGLETTAPMGVVDLVPAARTVLVRFDARVLTPRAVSAWIGAADPVPVSRVAAPAVAIRVHYDGPDLQNAADSVGLSTDSLIGRHTSTVWTSAFVGFAPGFAYLVADEPLPREVPRHPTSRTTVEPGSVGLAGPFSGVYPRSSPGGWQLIGRTDAVLWDPDGDPPALLGPGTRVRFEAVAR